LDGRHLRSWGASIFLHLLLVVFAARLLFCPVQFAVTPGETSTELELIQMESPPHSNVPKTLPVPLTPSPLPIFHREQLRTETAKIPLPPRTPAVHAPSQAHPVSVSAQSKIGSVASKGAVAAIPDDLHNAPPEYPEESRLAREEGLVVLRVKVTPQGEPAAVEIFCSSGYFRLDQAALRAVKQWRFHPATFAGRPVPSEIETPVRFRLE
jgi:protein TonB